MLEIFILLVAFQIKHFLADYPLQTPYMLRKFLPYPDYLLPLTFHAATHGLMTLMISVLYSGQILISIGLGAIDMLIHFGVDRIKASPNLLGKFKALSGAEFATASETQKKHNTYFWWSLGADQMAHHLTHYWIIWTLICCV